jgi:hypothetical protein
MFKHFAIGFVIIIILSSCEKVIQVDLNSSNPAFVVEAKIFKDSVCLVNLTRTTSYFSQEKPDIVEDASIKISDGNLSEALVYTGNGYYIGKNISGTEGQSYKIEINHDGVVYEGISDMPSQADIISVDYSKSDSPGILNPEGKSIYTITCEFSDNPDQENYYMIRFISNGKLLERYYLLTEKNANSGVLNNSGNGIISFSESIFFEGGAVDIQLFSIDKPVYDYFLQLSDILFWKRRVIPPTPYNPLSNLNNGALGYFAAWAVNSRKIVLE